MKPADSDVAADQNSRLFPGISPGDGNGSIEFQGFRQGVFGIILFGGFSHQPGIDHEEVPAGVVAGPA